MANVDIQITIVSRSNNTISTGRQVGVQNTTIITDTVDELVLQEYIDHVTPKP